MKQSYEVLLKTLEDQLEEHQNKMMYLETNFSISNDEKMCTITLTEESNEKLKNRYQSSFPYEKQEVEEFLMKLVHLCALYGAIEATSRSANQENSGAINDKVVFSNHHVLYLENVEYDLLERLAASIKGVTPSKYLSRVEETSVSVEGSGGFSSARVIAFLVAIVATLLFVVAFLYR